MKDDVLVGARQSASGPAKLNTRAVQRILHLALDEEDPREKDYHLRRALQHLVLYESVQDRG
jgi:hypothetical protein